MASPETALRHYESQLRQAEATVLLARRQWRKMTLADLDRSWSLIVQRLTLIGASGMLGAAKAGAEYVPEAVEDDTAAGLIAAAPFGQSASDGRPLDSLLYAAVVRVKLDLASGAEPPDALAAGGEWLETLLRTQVADAGRSGAGVAIVATPRTGWLRYVSPPCCQRCAVLAGKFFKWNDGFQRHPKCDCRHFPVKDGDRPRGHVKSIEPDQVRDLTKAQRQAVSDGANLNQVVNARRRSNGMTTTEGTTRRGYASKVRRELSRQRAETADEVVNRRRGSSRAFRRTTPRLTPEAIYRLTAGNREKAIRLLYANGYIVGDIEEIARRVA